MSHPNPHAPGGQRVALVTGAAGGIGRAVRVCLEAQGVSVIGVDLGGTDIAADLGDTQGRADAAEAVLAAHPVIDAVITCAGISLPEDGARATSVNFFGAARFVDSMQPALVRSAAPRVVVISSIATLFEPDMGIVDACLAGDENAARAKAAPDGNLAYASSKYALTRWIRRTAASPEWGGKGILVNGVSPGTIKTAMANDILADAQARAALMQAVPLVLDDYAEPEDIAPLIAFLASPENRFLVGQVMFADGGSDVLLRGDHVI